MQLYFIDFTAVQNVYIYTYFKSIAHQSMSDVAHNNKLYTTFIVNQGVFNLIHKELV